MDKYISNSLRNPVTDTEPQSTRGCQCHLWEGRNLKPGHNPTAVPRGCRPTLLGRASQSFDCRRQEPDRGSEPFRGSAAWAVRGRENNSQRAQTQSPSPRQS